MTSETAETIPVTTATSDVVTSSTAGLSAAVSTSNQLITSDVSSSLIQSVTTGDAATTTDLTTTTEEAGTGVPQMSKFAQNCGFWPPEADKINAFR